ncbi:UPF0587 protein [Zancudomyces culisetae]|uniref:UPF0587 protein n=1 Tax=Zancudomyces culisetae TaxID=1213189 RepID=A0A1R1PU47_ZANCU|nr:UPF0587 protein [Zancudomyces culisetae]|eukprot:OMH84439.1 UPF0587 protein [Zancudomyces culisetae]
MKIQQILTLDCRGIEPVEFSPKGEWIASGVDSVTKFNEIDFSMGDWADYDENADVEVSIMDFESSFVKLK